MAHDPPQPPSHSSSQEQDVEMTGQQDDTNWVTAPNGTGPRLDTMDELEHQIRVWHHVAAQRSRGLVSNGLPLRQRESSTQGQRPSPSPSTTSLNSVLNRNRYESGFIHDENRGATPSPTSTVPNDALECHPQQPVTPSPSRTQSPSTPTLFGPSRPYFREASHQLLSSNAGNLISPTRNATPTRLSIENQTNASHVPPNSVTNRSNVSQRIARQDQLMGPPATTNVRGLNPRSGLAPYSFNTTTPWAPVSGSRDTRFRIITNDNPSQLTLAGPQSSDTVSHLVVATGAPPSGPAPHVSAWPTAGLAGVDESLIDPILLEPTGAPSATDPNVAIINGRREVQPMTRGRVTQLDDENEESNAVNRNSQSDRTLDPLPDSVETLLVRTIAQITANAGSEFRTNITDDMFEVDHTSLRSFVPSPTLISPPIRTTNGPHEDNYIRRRAQLRGVNLDDVETSVNIRGDTRGWRIDHQHDVSALDGGNGPSLPKLVYLRNETTNTVHAYQVVDDTAADDEGDEDVPSALDMFGTTSYNPSSDTFFDTVSYVQTPVKPIVVEDDDDMVMYATYHRAPEEATWSEERAILEYELMIMEAREKDKRDSDDEEHQCMWYPEDE